MPRTFSIKTLGCKLNQYESSLMAHRFLSRGWEPVDFGQAADAVIINTCTVTDRSDKKCRNLIRQGARFARGGGVIVTGCLAEARREELRAMPEVAAAFGNSDKDDIVPRIEMLLDGDTVREPRGDETDAPLPYLHTRGFLKIQDGCDNNCSYCIVPSVRGRARSRDFGGILDHARKLAGSGCPELVLTGITIGNYSHDGRDLAGLVEALAALEGDFRIRITSIEPNHVDARLAALLAHPRVCPHLHLPLQSGSDRVLSLMNRPYTKSGYLRAIDMLRSANPGIAIGADIIIGFPGEEEGDFLQSLEMVRAADFAYVHQFTFSPRSGTAAAGMTGRVSARETGERGARLREAALERALAYRRAHVGKVLPSVVEKNRGAGGYTAVSGNYIKIILEDSEITRGARGKLAGVMLGSVSASGNLGHVIRV
jgi:threonylcarbamoyladenosine tRNA methylthiotransferase MtaB